MATVSTLMGFSPRIAGSIVEAGSHSASSTTPRRHSARISGRVSRAPTPSSTRSGGWVAAARPVPAAATSSPAANSARPPGGSDSSVVAGRAPGNLRSYGILGG